MRSEVGRERIGTEDRSGLCDCYRSRAGIGRNCFAILLIVSTKEASEPLIQPRLNSPVLLLGLRIRNDQDPDIGGSFSAPNFSHSLKFPKSNAAGTFLPGDMAAFQKDAVQEC